MRELLLIIIVTFLSGKGVYSQKSETDKLILLKNNLIIKRDKINDSIKKVDARINYLTNKKSNTENTFSDYIYSYTRSEAKIKDKPSFLGNIIGYVEKNSKIKVFDYYDGYWLVQQDSIKGYTSEIYLENNYKMDKIKNNHAEDRIKKKYSTEIANRILKHKIWLGMTAEMAKLSIGSPLDINRTIGDWGIHEQWIYENQYLYFENYILKSWQD